MNRNDYLDSLNSAWRDGGSSVFMKPEPPRWPPELLSSAWHETASPRYWEPPIIGPVEQVTVPEAQNPSKGSGLTPLEIEKRRRAEQAAFVERLQKRWLWSLAHVG
jgi:hypothetical protein